MFKTAVSLEATGKVQIAALDKTGTITEGDPKVTDIIPVHGVSKDELMTYAYSLEAMSEHPLAKAVVAAAEERGLETMDISDFRILPGSGLSAMLDGEALYGGSLSFASETAELDDEIRRKAESLAEEGKTPLFFIKDKNILGMIAVADVIKRRQPGGSERAAGYGHPRSDDHRRQPQDCGGCGKTGRSRSGHRAGAA